MCRRCSRWSRRVLARSYDGFCSLDWGFNAPFSCHWWVCLPDGRYHVCREWKEAGVYADEFAKEFWKITRQDVGWTRPRYVVAGGDVDNKSGLRGEHGQSVKETLQRFGLPMKDADKSRKPGWYRVHELLGPSPYGTPWLTFDPSCKYILRTLPAAPRDKDDEDEVDPKFTDDHGIEDVRYGAMSRPSPTRYLEDRKADNPFQAGTLLKEAILASTASPVLGAGNVRGAR